jgi:hypothetical protein
MAEPQRASLPVASTRSRLAPKPRLGVRAQRPAVPSRTPGEWVLIAVLLGGLSLNAVALLTNAALTGADRLLGSAVFLVGLALLVLIEICRRTGHTSR